MLIQQVIDKLIVSIMAESGRLNLLLTGQQWIIIENLEADLKLEVLVGGVKRGKNTSLVNTQSLK